MRKRTLQPAILALALTPTMIGADPQTTPWINMYGNPGGLIDMPTAEVAQDARLVTGLSYFGGTTKTALTFQVTPKLSGSFRYSALNGFDAGPRYTLPSYYDRSFDLHYQLFGETRYRPAIALGLRDLLGTGLYEGEYIVATKSIGKKLRLTGGLGWGRLGSHNTATTFGTRPSELLGGGGIPNYDRWFRGPMAPFAGISYQHNARLSFAAEYSSDAYLRENGDMFAVKSPVNLGINYKLNNTVQFGAAYMYGSTFGLNVAITLDPKSAPVIGGNDPAPQPVALRKKTAIADLGWTFEADQKAQITKALANALAREGIKLEGLKLAATKAEIMIHNERYDIDSQAIGRTMRVMSRVLPASVATFTVTQSSRGMPTGSVALARADLEALENAPASAILQRASFSAQSRVRDFEIAQGRFPRLAWSFGPLVKLSAFDPDSPVRADLVAHLEGQYHISPGWVASGAFTYKLGGNLDGLPEGRTGFVAVDPAYPVRSDARLYASGSGPKIDHLTLARYGRLSDNLYSRVTVGYLEQMYAGASGELLWKPVNSRLAIGAELNYVAQRDYDQQFGTRGYKIATGHISAYYDLGNGFHTQLDAGRYLAGDWGVTTSLDREFGNGWRIGAYVTKTNLSSESFGEGSFDKGIRITVPMSWAIGSATKRSAPLTIQSLTRDGGARLNVNGRLYQSIRSSHGADMAKTWGRFWR